MRRLLQAGLVAVILGTSGCANMIVSSMYSTPRIPTEKLSQLKEGVSTKADVIRLLGKPTTVSRGSDGSEVLKYTSTQYPALMVGTWKSQNVEVHLDAKGILQKYHVSEGDSLRSNF